MNLMEPLTNPLISPRSACRILIVEDEILIADMLARYLEKREYQVVGIAISYEEAKQLYFEEQPDLILLDIRLSGSKTGIDFAHFIQQQPHAQPFIFLSSQIDSLNISRAKRTFPAGYLSKPIQKESLYATIEIAMHRYVSEKETVAHLELFDGTRHSMVSIKDILYLRADHVYVEIHLVGNKKIIQRSTLKDLLDQLPSDQFIQTHRSFAINLKSVERWDAATVYLNDQHIPISRARRKIVTRLLKTG